MTSTLPLPHPDWARRCRFHLAGEALQARGLQGGPAAEADALRVQAYVEQVRREGHRHAQLDPLQASPPLSTETLQASAFGLEGWQDLPPTLAAQWGCTQVSGLQRRLLALYTGALSLDCSALRDDTRRRWLQSRFEGASVPIDRHQGLQWLERLIEAQAWEQFLEQRLPLEKRFSLTGCEGLILLLDALCEQAAAHGVQTLEMGMPHRGRLAVLALLLNHPVADILEALDSDSRRPRTDLAYHHGAEARRDTAHGTLALRLAPNPSHLQSIQPVVLGRTRACQDASRELPRAQAAMALLLHGDAAFDGQGIVGETLLLSRHPAYEVGGCVHVLINNQIGFTTAHAADPLRQRYASDASRVIDAPVLRVRADAPEQLARAAELALAYRMAFAADIVIDLVGFRRPGHSEHDLPMLTRPQLQRLAEAHPSAAEQYGAELVARGRCEPQQWLALRSQAPLRALARFGRLARESARPLPEALPPATPSPALPPLDLAQLQVMLARLCAVPEGFILHEQLVRLHQRWCLLARRGGGAVDWCLAENLAHATVLAGGQSVRLTGMDVERGTFMHRHAVWHAQGERMDRHVPLQSPIRGAARFEVINSPLSEAAALGFEYGYSLQRPEVMTVWEAQFGDFVNGAQVYLDQYIASGEAKWGLASSLTVLLPHGHEGVGPEHSNAHLGRLLQLCAEQNLRVACPSDSAQWFHLLREQARAQPRRPLIVFTPKSQLLQDPLSHAPLERLMEGGFRPLQRVLAASAPCKRVWLCSGKLRHELARALRDAGEPHTALWSLEQLYPLPGEALRSALAQLPDLEELLWIQEEQRAQGAWPLLREALEEVCPAGVALRCISRPDRAAGPSPSPRQHRAEQQRLWMQALAR
ncbi:2-oxoglutarate dehydrogenase E1 component [Roseateles sp. DB2]|uniref:2-oxoglutarate dehydrogenase E1 component n=1 Tax=Roseateles sp. DB2 TaxID=3453717 RepID=UPI003EEAEDB6